MTIVHHALSPADRDAMGDLRAWLSSHPITPSRATFDELCERVPAHPDVEYRDAELGGVRGTWCTPVAARAGHALFYLHGGAFVFGTARAFRHFVGQLAVRVGTAAFVADYRLAPEHPFPAAWDDAKDAYDALAHEVGADGLALAGDSAGGGLALALLASGRSAAAAVLFSPWTDLTLRAATIDAKAAEDPILSRAALETSPVFASRGATPLQVHVGTAEILLDDSLRLDATAPSEIHVWDGLPHVFPRSIATFEAAPAALDLAAAFLRGAGDAE